MNSNDWQPHEPTARTEYVVSLERKLAAAEAERDEARAQLENVLDASKEGAWMARALDAERNNANARSGRWESGSPNFAKSEVARLTAQLESITAENHARAQREARSLEEWASLRAEVEMLRGVGCREAKAGEPESGPCGVCLKCAEEQGARWALDSVGWSRKDDRWSIARRICVKARNEHIGWIQCTQCGWGCEVHRFEVEAGDYVDRQACDSCGIGPCRIDWTYPDGPGWVANKEGE